MVGKKKKSSAKNRKLKKQNGNSLTRLPFKKRIKVKLKEIPALLRAKKEEKKHLVSDKELSSEQNLFEKYALSMKRFILKKKKVGKKK